MTSSTRSRFQRLALLVLGALLVVFGLTQISGAIARAFTGGVSGMAATTVLFDETFRVAPGEHLDLDLGSEAVTVRTVRGNRARVVVEGSGRDAAREFERRRFSAHADDGLVVRTDPPRRMFSLRRTNARFEVTVEIPRRFDVDLDVGSGAVQVETLDGDLAVDTGSGAVRLADVTGDRVTVDTGSGSVRAGRLQGEVTIDTGSGSVRVERAGGPLTIDTGSGAVEVGLAEGPAHVDTGSGGVRLALASRSPVEIDTGSGGVSLTLPRAGFDVDLEGGRVEIDEALGFRGERERDRAEGTLGRGGPLVDVNTGSGRVRLRAR